MAASTEVISRTRYLPKLSIDSATSYQRESLASLSSLSSSTRASLAPSFDNTSADSDASFYVVCLFDFDTDDPDQMAFQAEEVLRVVKTEETVSRLYINLSIIRTITETVQSRAGGLRYALVTLEWVGFPAPMLSLFQKTQSFMKKMDGNREGKAGMCQKLLLQACSPIEGLSACRTRLCAGYPRIIGSMMKRYS